MCPVIQQDLMISLKSTSLCPLMPMLFSLLCTIVLICGMLCRMILNLHVILNFLKAFWSVKLWENYFIVCYALALTSVYACFISVLFILFTYHLFHKLFFHPLLSSLPSSTNDCWFMTINISDSDSEKKNEQLSFSPMGIVSCWPVNLIPCCKSTHRSSILNVCS